MEGLTDDHASAHIAELGLLAVVVLELVGFVVDRSDGLRGRRLLLLLLHLLIVDEVYLGGGDAGRGGEMEGGEMEGGEMEGGEMEEWRKRWEPPSTYQMSVCKHAHSHNSINTHTHAEECRAVTITSHRARLKSQLCL